MNRVNEVVNKTAGKISLIIVPLMFALSELFHPITMDTVKEEIISAGKFQGKWLIAHLFALVSIIFLPYLVNRLGNYINDKFSRFAAFCNFIAHIGIIAIAGLLVYDFILWDAWKIHEINVVSLYLETISASVFGMMFMKIGPIFFFIGLLSMFVLIMLSGKVKLWASILVVVGLLMYALAGPLIPVSNGHIVVSVGAFIMLAGFIGIIVGESQKA